MDLREEVRNGGEWADSDAGGHVLHGLAEEIWALGICVGKISVPCPSATI